MRNSQLGCSTLFSSTLGSILSGHWSMFPNRYIRDLGCSTLSPACTWDRRDRRDNTRQGLTSIVRNGV